VLSTSPVCAFCTWPGAHNDPHNHHQQEQDHVSGADDGADGGEEKWDLMVQLQAERDRAVR
jgi:hypothetical protein